MNSSSVAASPGAAPRGEFRVLLLLDRDIGGIPRIEVMEPGNDLLDVRRHSGARCGDAVPRAGSGAARGCLVRRMPVAAPGRVMRREAVAEEAGRVVRDRGVLAAPTRAVRRIERIDVH